MRISLLLTAALTLMPEAYCFTPVSSHVQLCIIKQRQHSPPSCHSNFPASPRSSMSLNVVVTTSPGSSMYLVRIVFLRALAFLYAVAFTIAYKQNKALIGDAGLTPARIILDQAEARANQKRIQREEWVANGGLDGKSTNPFRNLKFVKLIAFGTSRSPFFQRLRTLWDRCDASNRPVTTLLWLARDRENLNPWLDRIALLGIGISSIVFVLGAANLPLLLALWVSQRSLWAVGGPWYGYGWETQLAELGFHSLLLAPILSMDSFASPAVPPVVVWSMRWFLFRIMMGAGLIKIKGGQEWKDLTAMYNHYETQPIPNPLSRYFHSAPLRWHRGEVLTNHFVELIAPWMLLLPIRRLRIAGGFIQIAFQFVLILSGNLSFLNWLTAAPALFCFDDSVVMPLFSSFHCVRSAGVSTTSVSWVRRVINVIYGIVVIVLSVPVVRNLGSRKQVMNGSFDSLRLINTYGAFGTVNNERTELIVSSALNATGEWREYEFPAKPGDVDKSPRWVSPYHYRLDWQMWIASQLGSVSKSPWMYTFLAKLLECDKNVMTTLMRKDPWDGQKPKYIRIDRYRYKFHRPEKGKTGPYWQREYVGRWYPRQGVCTMESLRSDQILSNARR